MGSGHPNWFFPDHGEHGEPHVGERLGREATVPDAQHVRHRLEQRPRVLLEPVGLLKESRQMEGSSDGYGRFVTLVQIRPIRWALGWVNPVSWLPLAVGPTLLDFCIGGFVRP